MQCNAINFPSVKLLLPGSNPGQRAFYMKPQDVGWKITLVFFFHASPLLRRKISLN